MSFRNFKCNMFDEIEYPTIILSTKYHKHIDTINTIDYSSVESNFNLASSQEVSFDVYKKFDDKECSVWDDIVDFKYIYIPDFQEYYSIQVSTKDDDKTMKHITATSACEYELSSRRLYNFECNTEEDILHDDYVPTIIYNSENPNASLLDRVLKDKCPDYAIKHVDESIAKLQRIFSVDNKDIYSFLTSDVAEEINCLFVFNSVERGIYVYDLETYGENTDVYISSENYAELITVEGNSDNVFNCLRIEGGDDLMTATVANINPNGSNCIYSYPKEMLDDMPEELVQKLNSYNELYNELKPAYEEYTENVYQAIDDELYLTSKMMPEITTPTTSAEQELSNLILEITEVAVANISVLSNASADIAVRNMANVIVDTRYEVSIISSTLSDLTDGTYRIWAGKFKVTNKGNDEDFAESTSNISVKIVGNNYEEYLYQKIQKTLNKDDSLFYSIFEIEDLDMFKEELKKYCLDRLKSFESSYQTCIDVLIENGVTDQNAVFYDVDLYNEMYLPYYNRILAIQAEMVVRESEISEVQEQRRIYESLRYDIQKQLDFKEHVGDDLWFVLSHYLREDTYSNSNYISDGLDNAELIDRAKELFNAASTEINKASELQFTLTSTLLNLLNIKEFKPFKDKIAIGNWINVKADDILYKLRLISIGIGFGGLDNISVTFSNVIKVNGVISDAQSILEQTKSMVGSYDYVAHQANQGNKAQENVQSWIDDGLNSSLVQIKNNDKEEIMYDDHGLWARSWDDVTESYLPEQLRITSNILAFTKDNWLTCSAALGKHSYIYYDETVNDFVNAEGYGLSCNFLQSGYIYGSQIIGGDIYSDNYSTTGTGTHINLRDGSFSFAGDKLKYDGTNLDYTGNVTITGGDLIVKDSNSNILLKADVTNNLVSIGGFTVKKNAIYSGTSTNTSTTPGIYLGTDGIRQYKDASHYVDIKDGILTAQNANISGTIKSSNAIITGGSVNIVTNEDDYSYIKLLYNDIMTSIQANGFFCEDGKYSTSTSINSGSVSCMYGSGKSQREVLSMGYSSIAFITSVWDSIKQLYIDTTKIYLSNQIANFDVTVYTPDGTVSKSDKELKKDISSLSVDDSAKFIYSLTPSKYKLINGNSNRFHHGFIAQDVKKCMGENDWGIYIDTSINNDDNIDSYKALRYEELIADLVATLQSQNKRIKLLEEKLKL